LIRIINQMMTWAFIRIFKILPKITGKNKMVDPRIDEKGIFSYYLKPNMQLGLPNQRYATQVTPEGRLFTGAAEFVFFVNKKLVNKRLWTLKEGYLPCVCYELRIDDVVYKFEMFQYWLDKNSKSTPVNFVNIKVINESSHMKVASIAVGFKFSDKDHRPLQPHNGDMKQTKFKRWTYQFNKEYKGILAIRDNKLMYYSPNNIKKLWKDVRNVYKGAFKNYKRNRIVLITEYALELKPSESKSIIVKIPYYPINIEDQLLIKKISKINYEDYFQKFKDYWNKILNKGMKIILPEDKVINTSKTNLIFNFMTQDHEGTAISQKVNRFQYNHFWIRDSSFYIRMYNMFNYPEVAKGIIYNILRYQQKNGNFMSQSGQLDGFGQSLWAFAEHIKFNNDKNLAERLFNPIDKAIKWFDNATSKDKFGIMPPTSAFDNEFVIGHYTGHNLWALIGLKSAIYISKFLNRTEKLAEYIHLYKRFKHNFLQLLSKNVSPKFISPPGLNIKGGIDWGNILLIYPMKLFNPGSKLIVNTFNNYYENKMAEGIATWMAYLHHYLTERVAQSFLIMGDQQKVLNCFYSMLLHTGSCNEGFEMGIFPWGNRDYEMDYIIAKFYNFPPHGWFGVTYNTLLRNMLIREEDDCLHLLSAISPAWTKENEMIQVENAPTYFGIVNFRLKIKNDGALLDFEANFRNKPRKIYLHIPFFAENVEVFLENKRLSIINEKVDLEPLKKFTLEIKWKLRDITGYNYDFYVKKYIDEYKRKYFKKYRK